MLLPFCIILGILCLLYIILDTVFSKRNTEYGITFIAGEIGAGKSTYAAKLAKEHQKRGWRVYSNAYIKGCYHLDVSDLEHFCAPENSLIIIDEASLEMNSRDFSKLKKSLLEFFKLSRHFRNKCVLISQTMTDTDKQIRDLSTNVLFVRKFINGLVSLPVRVRGHLGIGQDGQPCMQYQIDKLAVPLLLPLYFGMFRSFGDIKRDYIRGLPW